jgi:hypothetical protein
MPPVVVQHQIGTEVSGLDAEISFDPEIGLPWRHRFDAVSLVAEEWML